LVCDARCHNERAKLENEVDQTTVQAEFELVPINRSSQRFAKCDHCFQMALGTARRSPAAIL
jgi:hypothetical protein